MISWEEWTVLLKDNNDVGLRVIYEYPSSSLSGILADFSKPNIGRCVEQKSGKSYFGSAHKTDKVRNCHCAFVLRACIHIRFGALKNTDS